MTDEIREEWECLVGRYILICGDIELTLCQLYWNLMIGISPKIKINTKSFKEKALEIRDISKNNEKSSENLKKLITRVITVTDKRNLIAHNPLYLDAYMNNNGKINFAKTIRSLRDNSKHMTLRELENEILKAKKVSKELIEQVMIVGGFQGENA